MIEPLHKKLLEKLQTACDESPAVRFGQLLANLALLVEDQSDRSLWDIEDQDLIEILETHLKQLSQRKAHTA
jgi:hypothetical protein